MLIFVDFDDTLCLHRKAIVSRNFIGAHNPYQFSEPNRQLIEYLREAKKKDESTEIILLTMSSSFMLEHKKSWCLKNCQNLIDNFVGLSIDCSKRDFIENYSSLKDDNELIFIDDSSAERKDMESLPYVLVLSPQMVANIK